MRILEEAVSLASLRAALDTAARNRGGPGPDGLSVAQFAAQGDTALRRLQNDVLTEAYRPHPARLVRVSKPGGGYRTLAIGCVRDRVLQHALTATLSSTYDEVLHPFAYGWRRGRSPRNALDAVTEAIAAGATWALRGDIESFFERIPPALLRGALRDHIDDEAVLRLLDGFLGAGTLVGGTIVDPGLGTAQGSPLSPFLANLYLVPFDRAVEAAGFRMVRYGDDLCVPTASRAEAERARGVTAEALSRLRLSLNTSKVEIRHIGEGFCFLGFQLDTQGRRPSGRAARSLANRLESLLRDRPNDGHEEIDELLRGWLGYYGSLSGVALPAALREHAEALEARRVERMQFGPVATSTSAPRAVAPALETAQPTPTAAAAATEATEARHRWRTAATRLAAAIGTTDEARAREEQGRLLGVAAPHWPELAGALARFDGPLAAELLARAGRFADAQDALEISALAAVSAPATARTRSPDAEAAERHEPPRMAPTQRDAERMLALFGGAERVHFRDALVSDRVERTRVFAPLERDLLLAHLRGEQWLGVYPLRANNSVRFAALRVVLASKHRLGSDRGLDVPEPVCHDVQTLAKTLSELDLPALVSLEPGRALLCWTFFAEAITAARARALLDVVVRTAGPAATGLTRELLPAQDVARIDRPGTGVLLPLGKDPRSGERAWILAPDTLEPRNDPGGELASLAPASSSAIARAIARPQRAVLGAPTSTTAPASELPPAPPAAPRPPETEAPQSAPLDSEAPGSGCAHTGEKGPAEETLAHASRPPDAVALATSPFRELPRARDIYAGCAVLRHFVDQAVSGQGLATSERYLLVDALGRLGQESSQAVDAVFRHLDDYRPDLGVRYLQRLYPSPTSCGRLRQRLPELTARLGCDCRFRVPPGAYPTPVLHAVGAAEVPGLETRVREAASRGGLARAAVAAMNEGRKELGTRAAALCARIAELRRQNVLLTKTIDSVERELDRLIDEAGDDALETPAGTLRRLGASGTRRFVLDL